jgi:antitoxin YefM
MACSFVTHLSSLTVSFSLDMRLSPLNRAIFSVANRGWFSGGEQSDFMRAQLDTGAADMYRETVRLCDMAKETTYTFARANFAWLCNEVAETREPFIIRRRGARDVALIAADELESLTETAHLLRSPKNAQRLLAAFQRARSKKLKPQSIESLRRDLGLDKEA